MYKSTFTIVLLAVAATAVPRGQDGLPLQLKEESITIEYTPASDEAVLVIEAESEDSLQRVLVNSPGGIQLFNMNAGGASTMPLQGFVVETRETDCLTLMQTYVEGTYELIARLDDGSVARGTAKLSHMLLDAPVVFSPKEGEAVPANDVEIRWQPDTRARAYQVVLEQNESDTLTVQLPAGSSSFRVPAGVLLPTTRSHAEVTAIAVNGNKTVVEVAFTTQ